VLDTNIFIRAARDAEWQVQLERFHAAIAPFELLSAVVVQELRAGVQEKSAATVERALFAPFERRSRVITPSYDAWKSTGEVLSALIVSRKVRRADVSRSFVNDVLLALSCRESGAVLVTENVRDFKLIAAVHPFDFVEPWPIPI
jgi:predicted nucleic acid-binding protein